MTEMFVQIAWFNYFAFCSILLCHKGADGGGGGGGAAADAVAAASDDFVCNSLDWRALIISAIPSSSEKYFVHMCSDVSSSIAVCDAWRCSPHLKQAQNFECMSTLVKKYKN